MWPDELNDLVVELSEKIRRHGDVFRNNETATRYSLIDPVLTALGWDLADTSQVRPEFPLGGRNRVADYAMLHETGRPQFFVEAKNLDTPINKDSSAVEQAINYTIRSDCEYVVITNGDTWEAYRPRASGELHERRTTAFRIADEDRRSTVMGMLWLWRWRWESAEPVDPPAVDLPVIPSAPVAPPPHVEYRTQSAQPTAPLPPVEYTAPPPQTEPTPPRDVSASHQGGSNAAPTTSLDQVPPGVPLSELNPGSGNNPPQFMVFPDGAKKDIGKWNRIQVVTVKWLAETGRLKEPDCPLTGPQGNYLVHTTPYKRNGALFSVRRQVKQYWVDVNYIAERQVRRAELILKAAGVDPATVFVSSPAQRSAPLSQSHLRPPVASPPPPTISDAATTSAETDDAPTVTNSVPLSELNPGKGQSPRRLMTFPDGARKPLRFWYELQIAVVKWLAETGRLTEFNCPLKTDGGAHIVDTSPVKQNGRPFDQPRQTGKYWIDTFPNAVDQVRLAKIILQRCSVDPATVFVS